MLKRFLLVFTGVLILFASCVNDMEKVKTITARKKFPDLSSNDIVVWYSDSGLVKAKLMSPLMDNYGGHAPYVEWPKGLHLQFFDDQMHVTSWLTANYAIRKESENIMEARYNVVVVNEKGEQLNTEHLVWDQNKEKITSDEFVKITTADEIIYGNGFESNQDFTQYKIFQIKGTINLKQ